jgi:hypothetical protein
MPTTRVKAENFTRELNKSVEEIRGRLGIERDDVVVTATVAVIESVRYSSREDED